MAAKRGHGEQKESAATQVHADKVSSSRFERKYTRLQSAHMIPDDRLPMMEPDL